MRRRDRLIGFAPIIDTDVELLILGSFPSTASLAAGRYYAHPRNQFWTILSHVLREPLTEMSYAERMARILAHRIGIWDVLGACNREGSLDAAIRRGQPNDFSRLQTLAPRLWNVVFNGVAAGKFAPLFARSGYDAHVLPSTSPAHAALSLQQKLALWRRVVRLARPRHQSGRRVSNRRN